MLECWQKQSTKEVTMAAIWQADIWCDDCADDVKDRICSELWCNRKDAETPDGTAVAEFDSHDDLYDYLASMDEREYDSGDYPKCCGDDEESDSPQHCGGGVDCINAEVLANGDKIGYFFGNALTTDGEDYVRETVIEDALYGYPDSVACTVWMPHYYWIDYEGVDNCYECGKLAACNDEGLCDDCAE
jgi:hypothetical protein